MDDSWFKNTIESDHKKFSLGQGDEGIDGWDQFETNKRLFNANIASKFNEDIYTKKLDMNKLTFEQIEKANRLANEIESKPTLNPHERIERNQISESEMLDMDEEALHSSVDRRASSHANHNNHPGNVGYSQDFRNSGSHRGKLEISTFDD